MELAKRNVPYWIARIKDGGQNHTANIYHTVNIYNTLRVVYQRARRCDLIRSQGGSADGDSADLEAAEEDLRNAMLDAYEDGDHKDNPLWFACMQIRPRIISAALSTYYAKVLSDIVWEFKEASDKDEDFDGARFFGRLACRLSGKSINFFRAVISGTRAGPYEEKRNGSGAIPHYFPGIPRDVGQETGVKLTCRPENLVAVLEAYGIMRDRAQGSARAAMEAHLRDIESLGAAIFPPKMDG